MDAEIEQLMDEVWIASLEKICKKECTPVRPSLGDFIDIFVPQARTLLLMAANPAIPKLIYDAARASANRNTHVIMKKLGMPADYFWKFEYWPKERAYETLRKVISKVFTTMMNRNKEGGLELKSVEIEPVGFTVIFKDCAECSGFQTSRPMCFYHTGTFAGILTSLINQEMDGYEIKCCSRGDEYCEIIIGRGDNREVSARVKEYLSPVQMDTKIDERLNYCLQGNQVRPIGNQVDIGYYNMTLLTSFLTGPEITTRSTFDVGADYGNRIAPLLMQYFKDNTVDVIKKYYHQLNHMEVKSIETTGETITIVLSECAETTVKLPKKELLDFLFGELQGILSVLLGKPVVFKESSLENTTITVKLSSQA